MKRECESCIKRKTTYCPTSMECMATDDMPYYQNRIMLLEENQELKKQLEEHKNKYIKRFEKLLAEDIEPDSEDFYLAEIEGKSNDYDKLLNQQKEFILYLRHLSNWYSADGVKQGMVNEILQKYKEMMRLSDDETN